jgi:hypothetical protein
VIHIVQCLCPARHAIVARLYDPAEDSGEDAIAALRTVVEAAIAAKVINPWCEICHAGKLTWWYEDAATPFRSLPDALRRSQEIEQANANARAILRAGRN